MTTRAIRHSHADMLPEDPHEGYTEYLMDQARQQVEHDDRAQVEGARVVMLAAFGPVPMTFARQRRDVYLASGEHAVAWTYTAMAYDGAFVIGFGMGTSYADAARAAVAAMAGQLVA